MLRPAAADSGRRRQGQILIHHLEKIQRGFPRGQSQIVVVIAEKVEYSIIPPDNHRGRQVPFQEPGIAALVRGLTALRDPGVDVLQRQVLNIGNVEGRRRQILHLALCFMHIDLFRTAHRLKQVHIFPSRLAFAKEQDPPGFQRLMKDGEQPPPHHRLEVDHHIAAADEVQLAERRIGEHIMRSENDHPPQFLGNLILVTHLQEVPGQPVRGDVVNNVLRIDPAPCLFESAAVHIGGKDLDVPFYLQFLHHLLEQNGDGIGLFSGRAAGRPNPDGLILLSLLYNLIDGIVFELFEKRGIPEKVGDTDENLPCQNAHLLRAVPEKPCEFSQCGRMGDQHPPFDPPENRGTLIVGEVDAAGVFQDGIDMGKCLLLGKGSILVGKGAVTAQRAQQDRRGGEIQDFLSDLLRREDKIRQPRVDNAPRHAVKLGTVRILCDDQSPMFFHRLNAVGAVRSRS